MSSGSPGESKVQTPVTALDGIRARRAAIGDAKWRAMQEGNQYAYGHADERYLPTSRPQAAARVDGLTRLWNPHATLAFLKLDAAWISRFKSPDAEFIAHAPSDIDALIALLDTATAALREFGQHDMDCPLHPLDVRDGALGCSCGFWDALENAPSSSVPSTGGEL